MNAQRPSHITAWVLDMNGSVWAMLSVRYASMAHE